MALRHNTRGGGARDPFAAGGEVWSHPRQITPNAGHPIIMEKHRQYLLHEALTLWGTT